ncbi:very short patch repair endonuclease [Thiolapillus brandeum]|uniref:very short patch repair endonuclease n=1 Tax=Thiolapillus brandeum TaxID=1076588 RepID=UPI0009E5AFC7|nr:very short patch repair endonuclease [Thiolapillus brandeum]
MTDIVDSRTRSRMMSAIRGKDTVPEMLVRKGLYARGFRYRLHDRKLLGKPDLVLPKYRAVVFVHGCFWHQHPNCRYAATPSTRPEFWAEKLRGNQERDIKNKESLERAGWRVFTVWECGLRHDSEGVLLELDRELRDMNCKGGEFPAILPNPVPSGSTKSLG